jgi:general stress protein YciG
MEYFKHDINASEDDKICELLANGGYEMFGYYWRFVEYLYSRGGFVYKNKLNSVAWILHMEIDKLNDLIYKFGLFVDSDETIYSKRILQEVQEFEANGKRMAEIGRKGGQASAKAKAQACAKPNAKADAQQKKENKKNKEKKENKINGSALSGISPDGDNELKIDFPLSKSGVLF